MNYSRKDLVQTDATMNQMRNSIHILASFMKNNRVLNLKEKLRNMGQSIAKTYIRYWKPTESVNISNLKDVMATIYLKVFNSTISIEINDDENLIEVHDQRCALCKYHYEDVEIAGCEIILGMVSEIISLINKESNNPSSLIIEPYKIIESRAIGNKKCIQLYKYKSRRIS